MKRLIAKYLVELQHPILVKRSMDDEMRFVLKIDDADVEVLLVPFEGHRGREKHEQLWSFEVHVIEISVSLPETEMPPPADITPKDGKGSYYEIEEYFNERFPLFTPIAEKVYLRLIKYFKYQHGMPFLNEHRDSIDTFPLPIWTDVEGNEIWKSKSRTLAVPYIHGFFDPEFGIVKIRKKDDRKLKTALERDTEISLYEEILADAKSAILRNNLRRGILEMAIACEIAVKQTFFAESTISGSAYEYLENKGRVRIKVIELIDQVASHTFGNSFKQFNERAYTDIDFLFRSRNRIAHRGEISYRDYQGKRHEPDKEILKEWWYSVEELLNWLSAY
jgi:hypothetical protein